MDIFLSRRLNRAHVAHVLGHLVGVLDEGSGESGSVTVTFFRYDISMALRTVSKRACETLYRFLSKGEVKMAGYWPSSQFFPCLRTETESRKKERVQYLAILTEQFWSIKRFIIQL